MMAKHTTHRALAGAACVAAAAIALAGCGGTTEADPTPVTTFQITPAAPGGATPTPPPVEATNEPVSGGATPVTGNGTTLELVGEGSTFDVEELTAAPGAITINFDNADGGVVHNVAVYPGDDASGDPIGATELEVGPVVQVLTLELNTGSYYYQCDAHPATMSGTLAVQ